MISEGIVEEFGQTSSKTQKVKVGGQWLIAGQVDLSGMEIGQKVGVQYHPWDKNPNTLLLDSWALLPHQPGKATKPNGPLEEPLNTLTKDECIFVCGVVNHAIEAKLILAHTDISTWVRSAIRALRHFDDVIPFDPPEEP